MWLATQHGFYSIVQKESDLYFVRARVRHDLVNLLTLLDWDLEIHQWEQADYRFRIILNREQLLEVMVHLGSALDYPNFKGRIYEHNEQFHKLGAYHKIWSVMADLQVEPASAD
jgi:hypothetical protein